MHFELSYVHPIPNFTRLPTYFQQAMGIIGLIWQSEEFHLLYNCSFYDVDSIPVGKRQDRVFALLLAFLGVVFEVSFFLASQKLLLKKG
jgi:hypothetical protein